VPRYNNKLGPKNIVEPPPKEDDASENMSLGAGSGTSAIRMRRNDKAKKKAQHEMMMSLLRPLRKLAVNAPELDLDSLGQLKPQQYDSDESEAEVEEDDTPHHFSHAMTVPEVASAINSFLDFRQIFANRGLAKSLTQHVSRAELALIMPHADEDPMVGRLCVYMSDKIEAHDRAYKEFPFNKLVEFNVRGLVDSQVDLLVPVFKKGGMRRVRTLRVEFGSGEGQRGIQLFLGTMTKHMPGELSDLDMRGSYMGDEGVTTLSKIFAAGLCPTLTRLNLAQNGCSDRGLRALALSIANNKSKIRLEALDLSRNDIHEDGAVQLFAKLKHSGFRRIQDLNLSYNDIDGSGFADKKLKESLREGGAAEWTRVNLSYNPIGDEGMVPTFTALSQSHASSCPELVKLELCGSELGDPSMTALSSLMMLGHVALLVKLDLSFNWIHPNGVKALLTALRAKACPVLTHLDLSNNNMGDDGINQICVGFQVGGISGLEDLDISNNGGRHSMMHLSMMLEKGFCPELRRLGIAGNFDGNARVKRLFKPYKKRIKIKFENPDGT